jgi:hypothetical protein
MAHVFEWNHNHANKIKENIIKENIQFQESENVSDSMKSGSDNSANAISNQKFRSKTLKIPNN